MQATAPKTLAGRYGVRPGEESRFEAAGTTIRNRFAAARPAR